MSGELPGVSIIMPARDVAPWVAGALASIGPDPDLEILVVDDGSRDGTGELLALAARQDPRIRILAGTGRGPSAARNLALAEARAPLVAFLDSDDRWLPGKLARQRALHAANPEIGFSFTDYRHVTPEGWDRGPCFAYWPRFAARHAGQEKPFLLGEDAMAQIYAENMIGTSTVVARTDLLRSIGGFGEMLPSAEDWDLWLRLAEVAPVGCVPQMLAEYQIGRPGATSARRHERLSALRIIACRHEAAVRRQDPRAIADCGSRLLVAAAEVAEADGQRLRAAMLRVMALIRSPRRRLAREAASSLLRSLTGSLPAVLGPIA